MARIIKGRQMTARYYKGREVLKEYKQGRLVYEKSTSIPDYLCFTALESGTFTLTIPAAVTATYLSYVEYSLDGQNWTRLTVDSTAQSITAGTAQNPIPAGGKVYWRGSGSALGPSFTESNRSKFSSSADFDVSGHIMSLLVGDNFGSFEHLTHVNTNGIRNATFSYLFKGCTTLVNAKDLVLPTFEAYYQYIFTGLFSGCTSLVTQPPLPSTTLAQHCYNSMFYKCTALPESATLPATTLAASCYRYMYYECSNLQTVNPILATTAVGTDCMNQMFRTCKKITRVELHLTGALTQACCYYMLRSCSALSYVKCLATDISATNCVTSWLDGVSPTGTFIQASGVEWPRGASGIPTGWLAYDEGEDIPNNYTMCDYIYNSSAGSVDLGFVFSTKSNSIEIKFKQDEISNGMPCGSKDGDGRIWFYNYSNANSFNLYFKPIAAAQVGMSIFAPLDTDTHIVKYVGEGNDQYYYHNGTRIGHGTLTNLSDTCDYNLNIFGRPTNQYKGRIYYLKVWNTATEEVICNLIPCSRNSDGAAGFWDTAQKQFFTSTYWTAHFDNE